MKKLLLLLLAFVFVLTAPTATAEAAKIKVATPTYKVTVSDTGKVSVKVKCSTKGAKIYFTTKQREPKTKDAYIKSGDTLQFLYTEAYSVRIRAYYNKTWSETVDVPFYRDIDAKYKSMLKDLVEELTAGLETDEDKLKAMWEWIMINTEYAYKKNTSKPDQSYADSPGLLFQGKAVCSGFAGLWEEMTTLAGFETVYLTERNHMYNATKVRGKWYVVDTTHGHKTNPDEMDYQRFLDNSQVGFSSNFQGYDLSSKRYVIEHKYGGTSSYFDYVECVEDGDGYFIYDQTVDSYSFKWYDEY